jgi:hypothetical protein
MDMPSDCYRMVDSHGVYFRHCATESSITNPSQLDAQNSFSNFQFRHPQTVVRTVSMPEMYYIKCQPYVQSIVHARMNLYELSQWSAEPIQYSEHWKGEHNKLCTQTYSMSQDVRVVKE